MAKKDYDKFYLTLQRLKVELYLSYRDMGFNASIVNSKIRWYELATYTIEENNDNFSKVYLHLNDLLPFKMKNSKNLMQQLKEFFDIKVIMKRIMPLLLQIGLKILKKNIHY